MDTETPRLIATLLARLGQYDASRENLRLPDWQPDDWSRLLAESEKVELNGGELLLKRGEQNRDLYFLVEGALEVSLPQQHSDSLTPPLTIHAGSVVGELAFFDQRGRSASVWSRGRSTLLRLRADAFRRFMDAAPRQACDLLLALGRIIAARLRQARGLD